MEVQDYDNNNYIVHAIFTSNKSRSCRHIVLKYCIPFDSNCIVKNDIIVVPFPIQSVSQHNLSVTDLMISCHLL